MTGAVLVGLFLATLFAGIPLAVGLGLTSVVVLAIAGFDQLAVPTNIYAGIAKYPLLAIPMFILAGMIFERSGVALRLVRFVTAIVASQSNLQGAYNALYAYAAFGLLMLIGLGWSLFQRAAHVAAGQRVAWVLLYAAGAVALVLFFGFVTLVMTNR